MNAPVPFTPEQPGLPQTASNDQGTPAATPRQAERQAVQRGGDAPATVAPERQISRNEKAAAILALLEDETLQRLQGRLPERHRERLIESARHLKPLTVQDQKRIAAEFAEQLKRNRASLRGSEAVANRLKAALYDGQEPVEMPDIPMDDIEFEMASAFDPQDTGVWGQVAELPLSKLTEFFEAKPASVFAVAICQMPQEKLSELAGELPEDMVKKAMVQIAVKGKPNPLAVEAIERLLEEQLLTRSEEGEEEASGNENVDRLAAVLNRLVSSRRDMVMTALREAMGERDVAEIEDKVLSFPALEHRLPRSVIPMLFREVDIKTLLTALKFGLERGQPVADYLLRNISQRLATQYREQMDAMPTVTEDQGEKAQSQVICQILALAEQDILKLLDPE